MPITTEGVKVLFMEIFPISELSSESTRTVVTNFRKGLISYVMTRDCLEECCLEEMEEWLETNNKLKKEFF